MNSVACKAVFRLVIIAFVAVLSFSCASDSSENSETSAGTGKSENFTVRITDKPLTFCNPLNVVVGSERARRAGEPVVVLHQDDYYLFITGGRGYWYSDNLRDWTYVDAPDFPWRLSIGRQ